MIYGALSSAQAHDDSQRKTKHSMSVLLLAAASFCIIFGAVALVLTQRDASVTQTILEQEISEYGTGQSEKEQDETEKQYEDTFFDDPGHISRAELRFRKALQAAGGLSLAHVARAKAYYETDMDTKPSPRRHISKAAHQKQTLTQWTAIPDVSDSDDGQVNIVINTPKKNAISTQSRLGMSSLAARQDLESYFDGLDHQIHSQERKHASEELQRLSSASPNDASGQSNPQEGASLRGGKRKTSMLRLLQKALESKKFERDVQNLKAELHVGWHTE